MGENEEMNLKILPLFVSSLQIIIYNIGIIIPLLMTVYSHSRLSTFEQCPHKFKLRYIDKVKTEAEESVEAFMNVKGSRNLGKVMMIFRQIFNRNVL